MRAVFWRLVSSVLILFAPTSFALSPFAMIPPARADVSISFYLGASQTRPSDLHVVQSSLGNDATMHRVPWPGYPFRFEPYYGLRLSYFAPGHPETRVALDFTHYKIYGRTEDSVVQDGEWHGAPLHEVGPMRERVQSFEMTHGLNMFGLSVLQQLSGSSSGIYVGGGPVLYVPHSESRVDGIPGGDFLAFGGFGFQAHTGVRGCVGVQPLFAEIKYNEGHPTVPIALGLAQTTLQTFHELVGTDFNRCQH
jgi:hypothetical protein